MKTKLLFALSFLFALGLYSQQWQRTVGPIGGLGYNIKIHPTNNQIIYITDALSGIHKSVDGGTTWIPKNNGITSRSGSSNDDIPVFTVAIDQNNPTTIWAGTQNDSGIYKSTDSADNWIKKTNGITETNIVFREISVVNGDSNTIYASGEVPTGNQGNEFEKVNGVIYKSIDGGENWNKIWSGSSLARWLCIGANPVNLVSSTGIFDREASNTTGVGILKSTDGWVNWTNIGQGIPDQTILAIALADNNSIIYAGTKSKGVYKSTDNGSNWAQILSEVNTTIGDEPTKLITGIVVNPTNKNNIVVGDIHTGVYMSTDAGANWTNISQGLTNRAITSLAFSSDGKTLFTGTKGVGVFSYNTSTLAIDNYQTLSDIKNVFPNPSSGKFTLDLQSNSLKSLDVEIFSILGKLVNKKTYRATNKKIEINIEDLSKGMYIVSYQLLNGQKKSSKILIE
jgi:photosystem II stability/assembly factor-like uncharacterized protein